jgi:hypothetical protein
VSDYEWQGLRFHNTGAMIHRVRSRIQTFTYDPDELQHALEPAAPAEAAKGATGL